MARRGVLAAVGDLAVFGLTPYERLVDGGPSVFLAAAHALGLHGRGNCTCHGAGGGY